MASSSCRWPALLGKANNCNHLRSYWRMRRIPSSWWVQTLRLRPNIRWKPSIKTKSTDRRRRSTKKWIAKSKAVCKSSLTETNALAASRKRHQWHPSKIQNSTLKDKESLTSIKTSMGTSISSRGTPLWANGLFSGASSKCFTCSLLWSHWQQLRFITSSTKLLWATTKSLQNLLKLS